MADPSVELAQYRIHPVPIIAAESDTQTTGERRIKANTTLNLKPYGKASHLQHYAKMMMGISLQYVFQIWARNAIGDSSPYTVKGSCVTVERQPARNPSNVRTNSTSSSQLTVVWDTMPRDGW